MGEAAAAAIIRKERRIIGAFRDEGATSPEAARSPGELGVNGSWVVDRLIDRGVLRQAEPGRYYLDEEAWTAFCQARRRRAIIVVGIIVVGIVCAWLIQMARR